MPINILMPALSPTMEKGNLAKWLKREGDPVKPGDILAEIETDKATMEVEAVDDGVLAKIIVPDGTADVAVNQLIGIIAIEGEDAVAAAKGSAPGQKAAPVAALSAPSPRTRRREGPSRVVHRPHLNTRAVAERLNVTPAAARRSRPSRHYGARNGR